MYQTRGFLQIAGVLVSGWWLKRSAKPINTQCLAGFGSIGWQCVWHLPVGCVCVWVLKRIEKPIKNLVFFKIRIHWLAVCMASTGRLRFKVYRHWFTNRKPIKLEVLIHFLKSEI